MQGQQGDGYRMPTSLFPNPSFILTVNHERPALRSGSRQPLRGRDQASESLKPEARSLRHSFIRYPLHATRLFSPCPSCVRLDIPDAFMPLSVYSPGPRPVAIRAPAARRGKPAT